MMRYGQSAMNETLAKTVWEKAYPDRRPWDQLEKSTQDEWTRVVDITINAYWGSMKVEPFDYPPTYLKDLQDYIRDSEAPPVNSEIHYYD